MVRRSSLIFAASLAVLSTFESTLGFAAAAPAQQHDEIEKPRFLRREVKRAFLNSTSTTSGDVRGPFGAESSSDSQSLTDVLTTPPAETTEATTSSALTQTLSDPLALQAEISQSLSALQASLSQSLTLPSISASAAPQEVQPSTSATPATSQQVTSNTNLVATESISVSATSPTVASSAERVIAQATSPIGSTETGGNIIPSLLTSSVLPSIQTSAPELSRQSGSNSPSSSPNIGVDQSVPSSQLPNTVGSLSTELLSGPSSAPNSVQVTDPNVPQTPTTAIPEALPGAETSPTTGITMRSASSPSSEIRTSNAGPASQTHSTTGQKSQSISVPDVIPTTKPSTTQNSPMNVINPLNTPSLSITQPLSPSVSKQSNSNTVGQQSSSNAEGVGITLPDLSKGQSSQTANGAGNTIQQPFTQPSQSRSSSEAAISSPTGAQQGSTSRIPDVNTIVPSSAASIQLPFGDTSRSNSFTAVTTPANAQTSASVASANSGTQSTASPEITPVLPLPTVGTSGIASLSIGVGQSGTNEAQPASSPSLPESASILPTASNSQPLASSGSGAANLPSTAAQQEASASGGIIPGSQSLMSNPLNTGSLDGSTPTGTDLYTALTNALGATVGPGSTMLSNGVITPITKTGLSGADNTISAQPGFGSTTRGQESGALPIIPAASITLSSGNVVPNPLASSPVSQQTGAASVTLTDGNVIPNPLVSNSVGLSLPSGVSLTQPGGSSISNPQAISTAIAGLSVFTSNGIIVTEPLTSIPSDASNAVVATSLSGPASITLSNGKVVPNPSVAVSSPSIVFSNGQSVTLIPSASESVSGSQPSVSSPSDFSGLPGSFTNGLSNSAQISTAQPQASTTNSNGVVVPIPIPSSAAVNTGVTNTGISQSISPGTSAVETGPVTLPSGSGVSGSEASPISSALPASGSSPVVVGSATGANGISSPVTAGQVTGSSTLSGGAVIPLTASNPPTGLASGTPISSSGDAGSQTLSGGAIVPVSLASVPLSASSGGQETGATSQTGAGQSGVSQATASSSGASGSQATGTGSQSSLGQSAVSQTVATPTAEGQTSGASSVGATGISQSQSQPTPSPVTGTATAPPNIAGISPSQVSVATDSQSFPSDARGPFTQQPTSYDTNTIQSVPTSILTQQSSTLSTQPSFGGPTGLPTGVPLVLYPPDGAEGRPENTDLIQIGFMYPLNYDFVYAHAESQNQIFKYLPMGIAWGLQIDIENVTMQSLRAWDTTQDLHYITTLALAWVPSGQVQALGLLVHTPTSRFYHTPDNSTNTLLSMINIALPIAADNSTDGGDTTSFGTEPSSTNTVKTGGAPVGDNIGSSNPVRASSVGIGCGVAAGAAAYGAAMFFVARRYRKRRQSHIRSPSMFSSPVMSHAGPDALAGAALMSGGVGDHRSPSPYHDEDLRAASRGSGRSASTGRQQISAPVMAENSLGWN